MCAAIGTADADAAAAAAAVAAAAASTPASVRSTGRSGERARVRLCGWSVGCVAAAAAAAPDL